MLVSSGNVHLGRGCFTINVHCEILNVWIYNKNEKLNIAVKNITVLIL